MKTIVDLIDVHIWGAGRADWTPGDSNGDTGGRQPPALGSDTPARPWVQHGRWGEWIQGLRVRCQPQRFKRLKHPTSNELPQPMPGTAKGMSAGRPDRDHRPHGWPAAGAPDAPAVVATSRRKSETTHTDLWIRLVIVTPGPGAVSRRTISYRQRNRDLCEESTTSRCGTHVPPFQSGDTYHVPPFSSVRHLAGSECWAWSSSHQKDTSGVSRDVTANKRDPSAWPQ